MTTAVKALACRQRIRVQWILKDACSRACSATQTRFVGNVQVGNVSHVQDSSSAPRHKLAHYAGNVVST